MTRPYPLMPDIESSKRPTHEPLWEATLEDGDLLYIPRGWWHVAIPLNEPTLHLTVGVHNRTGIDLLQWLANHMRTSEVFRMDLPRFASGDESAKHLARLRSELMAEWDQDLLARFYRDSDASATARPRVSLPWSATPEILPPTDETLVRLTAPRPLDLSVSQKPGEERIIEFSCLGKRWRFAEDALIILRPLASGQTCSVSELCEVAKGKLSENIVRAFLSELILHGLLAIINDQPQY